MTKEKSLSKFTKILATKETVLTIGFEERKSLPQYWRKFDSGHFTSPKYGEFHFTGAFPTFLPPHFYPLPLTTEEINYKVSNTIEVIKRCSVNSKLNSAILKKIESLLASTIIWTMKSVKINEEWEYHFYALVALSVELDDSLEMSHAFSDNPSALKTCCDLMRQIAKSDDKAESIKQMDSPYPALSPIINSFKQVGIEMEQRIPNFKAHSDPISDAVLASGIGLVIVQVDLDRGGYSLPTPLYKNLRDLENGALMILETLAACQEIHIPKDIRSNVLFQMALRHFSSAEAAVNDVCGLHREVFDEDAGISNIILSRVVKDRLSLNDSLRLRIREAQEETLAFIHAAKYLLQLYPDSEDLELFLIAAGIHLDETITVYETERYNNTVKFDVIEGDLDEIMFNDSKE